MGKTSAIRPWIRYRRKHPHGRGEDYQRFLHQEILEETPPRAWGRRSKVHAKAAPVRNTPTGVGKTVFSKLETLTVWKHPHGRGEDCIAASLFFTSSETPPRAWGRHEMRIVHKSQHGNTPTGVGKTHGVYPPQSVPGKHPHGRGEDESRRSCGC